jgi:hypothetical protein
MQNKHWLVEIRVKDWVFVPEGRLRTIGYYEVEAYDARSARYIAAQMFEDAFADPENKIHQEWKISMDDWCAPEAVEISY